MELRKLQATDLFTMVKIINGIGLKNIKDNIDLAELDDIRKRLKDDDSKENSEELLSKVGMKIVTSVVGTVIENLPKVEKDLYDFCGNVTGLKSKDVAKLEIGEFIDLLIAIVTKDEFKDFFKRASKLIK